MQPCAAACWLAPLFKAQPTTPPLPIWQLACPMSMNADGSCMQIHMLCTSIADVFQTAITHLPDKLQLELAGVYFSSMLFGKAEELWYYPFLRKNMCVRASMRQLWR